MESKQLSKKQIIALRLRNNGLLNPFPSSDSCVDALIGIQGQAQNFAEISIYNRVSPTINQKTFLPLYDNHTIVRGWGQRGTAHLYTKNDWFAASHIYFKNNKWLERMRLKNPILFDRMHHALKEDASKRVIKTKDELKDIVQSCAHSLFEEKLFLSYFLYGYCTMSGLYAGIPAKPYSKEYVSASSLLDKSIVHSDENKHYYSTLIMERYYKAYGPATLDDFCHWSGINRSSALLCLKELKSSLDTYEYDNRQYFTSKNMNMNIDDLKTNQVFLLGKFDPLFVSYRHKDWIVTKEEEKQIWLPSAIVEAVLFIGFKAYGTWRYEVKGKTITFNFKLFHALSSAREKQVETKTKKLSKFLGKELIGINYQLQKKTKK